MSIVWGYRAEIVLYDKKGRRLYVDCIRINRQGEIEVPFSSLSHAMGCAHEVTSWDDRETVSYWRVEE